MIPAPTMRFASPLLLLAGFVSLGAALIGLAANAHAGVAPYRKIDLNQDFFAEGATFGDLNRDGKADAIAGPFWYEGPDFTRRHELYTPPAPFDPLGYSNNFSAFVRDFNADTWPDVLLIGFPGKDASWLENPGAKGGAWRRHHVYEPVDNESPTFGDLLGDGRPVLICMSLGRIGYATPDAQDPTKPWTFHPASPPGSWHHFTHGLGFGDVNADGRADLLEKDGWWEQPASLDGNPFWKHHRFTFGSGAHIHVTDVNGDQLPDVITSLNAHGYGLAWFEQTRTADGAIDFRRHDILSSEAEPKINGVQFSQLHAVTLADIDGDGLDDIVTGKRWWAHGPSKDPEPNAAPVIYAFL
ncbi:MAG TPA: hypothetical protein VEA63_16825, partial [Opitutus sp.]|nr:hypothetical protein [Opitutus sp.]